jgi:hypothetical protein
MGIILPLAASGYWPVQQSVGAAAHCAASHSIAFDEIDRGQVEKPRGSNSSQAMSAC